MVEATFIYQADTFFTGIGTDNPGLSSKAPPEIFGHSVRRGFLTAGEVQALCFQCIPFRISVVSVVLDGSTEFYAVRN